MYLVSTSTYLLLFLSPALQDFDYVLSMCVSIPVCTEYVLSTYCFCTWYVQVHICTSTYLNHLESPHDDSRWFKLHSQLITMSIPVCTEYVLSTYCFCTWYVQVHTCFCFWALLYRTRLSWSIGPSRPPRKAPVSMAYLQFPGWICRHSCGGWQAWQQRLCQWGQHMTVDVWTWQASLGLPDNRGDFG
jgi:hypothetical protein